MKYKFIAVFLLGGALGAIASEQLNNGLYQFKAGDNIVASEVNANFTLLNNKIEEMKALDHTIEIPLNCKDSSGVEAGYFYLLRNKTILDNTIFTNNGPATHWSYSLQDNTFSLDSDPVTELVITPNYDPEIEYEMNITVKGSPTESYNCIRH